MISLAKALKVKNRLSGRMNKVTSDIQTYNSVLVEQAEQVNVEKLISLREELMNALIELKSNLVKANIPIQSLLIRLGELKAKVQFLQGISVQDGSVRHGYQNTEVVYKAYLKKNNVDQQVQALEKEIDSIQDELDSFNALTKIEINPRILELAS